MLTLGRKRRRDYMPGKFVRVKCKCKNEQVIFDKPATVVKCLVCKEVIAEPRASRAGIKAKVLGPAK